MSSSFDQLREKMADPSAASATHPGAAPSFWDTVTKPDLKNRVEQLPVERLHPYHNHKFKMRLESEYFQSLRSSIRENGVRTPLLIRPHPKMTGHFEIIAGHHRWMAAKEEGLTKVPGIVEELNDYEADQMQGETNIERPDWLPSEKAWSYKIHLEATVALYGIHAGRPADNSPTGSANLRADDLTAERYSISGDQLRMYIKLTSLLPDLLDMVDDRRIAVKAGYQLAFISADAQQPILTVMEGSPKLKINEASARLIREVYEATGGITITDVEDALSLNPSPTRGDEPKQKMFRLSLPDVFEGRLKAHKDDPDLLERIEAVIWKYLGEVERSRT